MLKIVLLLLQIAPRYSNACHTSSATCCPDWLASSMPSTQYYNQGLYTGAAMTQSIPLIQSHFNLQQYGAYYINSNTYCQFTCSISGAGCSTVASLNGSNTLLQISTSPNTSCLSCSIDCEEYGWLNGDPSISDTYGVRSVPFNIAACIPSWSSTQPESMTYIVPTNNPSKTTMNALTQTESNGCGFTISYSCQVSGATCPSWITFNAANQMVVTNPNLFDVGIYSVTLTSFFTDACGNINLIDYKTWILTVALCTANLVQITKPEGSPFIYNQFIDGTTTTTNALLYTDSNNCGYIPTYSCPVCPSFASMNALNQMQVSTTNIADQGLYSINLQTSYVNGAGTTVTLYPTVWNLNVECTPNFVLSNQPESPFSFTIWVDPTSPTPKTTTNAILFTDLMSCGFILTYSCPTCPYFASMNALNKMQVSTTDLVDQGLYQINLQTSYVNGAGTIVPLSNTIWTLQVIDPCQTTSFLPQQFADKVLISGLTDTIKIPEFQTIFGTLCGPQKISVFPTLDFLAYKTTGTHTSNNLSYLILFNTMQQTQGQFFSVTIIVTLSNYLAITATFSINVKLYQPILSIIPNQEYTTHNVPLKLSYKLTWSPQLPPNDNYSFNYINQGSILYYNNAIPKITTFPENFDNFYMSIEGGQSFGGKMSFNVYNKLNVNAGVYQISYSVVFQNFPGLSPLSYTFDLNILENAEKSLYNLAPNFVTPNNWYESMTLLCSQRWVMVIPPCKDPQGYKCTEKVELGKTSLFAENDQFHNSIFIQQDKLTEEHNGNYIIRVFISNGKLTTIRSVNVKVVCNLTTILKLAPNVTLSLGSGVIPIIERVNNFGQVFIRFSEPMITVNETNITNDTYDVSGLIMPILKLKMLPESKFFNFTWECLNYTSTQMILQIYFDQPKNISFMVPRDYLQVTFWGQPNFASQKANFVELGYICAEEMPAQIDVALGKMLASGAASSADVGKYTLIAATALTIVTSGPLQILIEYVKNIQVIVHMMCVDVAIPAGPQLYYSKLLAIVSFQLLPTSEWYDQANGMPYNEGISMNFEFVGYDSKYFLRNIGTIGLIFVIYPIFMLAACLLEQIPCNCAEKFGKKMKKGLYWNNWLAWSDYTYLIVVVSIMANFFKIDETDKTQIWPIINVCSASICCPVSLFFGVIVGSILYCNFEKIQELNPKIDKYEVLFKNLNIPTYIIEDVPQVTSGKQRIGYKVWNILRRLILGVSIVMLNSYPVFCIIFVFNFTTLASIVVVGQLMPLKYPGMNKLELFNEFLILILNYHLICLTMFVADPDRREDIGYSIIFFTTLFLAVNVGLAIRNIFQPYALKIKQQCIRHKRKQDKLKANERRIRQAQEREWRQRAERILKLRKLKEEKDRKELQKQIEAEQQRKIREAEKQKQKRDRFSEIEDAQQLKREEALKFQMEETSMLKREKVKQNFIREDLKRQGYTPEYISGQDHPIWVSNLGVKNQEVQKKQEEHQRRLAIKKSVDNTRIPNKIDEYEQQKPDFQSKTKQVDAYNPVRYTYEEWEEMNNMKRREQIKIKQNSVPVKTRVNNILVNSQVHNQGIFNNKIFQQKNMNPDPEYSYGVHNQGISIKKLFQLRNINSERRKNYRLPTFGNNDDYEEPYVPPTNNDHLPPFMRPCDSTGKPLFL